jgi:hypothetical protein
MNLAIMLTLVASFAILCTTHLSLVLALTLKKPRWKGPLALVLVPLAPYWGLNAHMRLRSLTWVVAFCLYILALVAASVEG